MRFSRRKEGIAFYYRKYRQEASGGRCPKEIAQIVFAAFVKIAESLIL